MHAGAVMPGFVVERHHDLASFRAAAFDWLAAREGEHQLPLGVFASVEEDPGVYGSAAPVLLTVRDPVDGRLVTAVIRTPPWRLILAEVDEPDALPLLADAVAEHDPEVPGVIGPAEHVDRFAASLAERLGKRAQRGLSERSFQLTRLIPPAPTSGHARLAEPRDRPLITDWLHAFDREAIGDGRPSADEDDDPGGAARTAARIDRAIARVGSRAFWLWEDDGPVSLAGVGGPTPNGIRIGPVYTPPDRRRRGYASAVVAAATQAALDEGRHFVFLFTDRANPTSNHIYQQLGYEPIRDVDEWSLVPADPS